MFEEVLNSDVSFAVVIEVGVEEADFVIGKNWGFFKEAH